MQWSDVTTALGDLLVVPITSAASGAQNETTPNFPLYVDYISFSSP